MRRKRRPLPKAHSISCTDAEWERVRVLARRRGLLVSRYSVECGLNVDPAAESEEAVLLRIRNALAFLVEARMREMVRDAGRYECPTFQPVLREDAMPLVIVKSKFQVTIPAKLRKGIELREGDIMEATLMGDGILLRPKQMVDRDAAADRISAAVAARPPLPEDVGRSEHEIMQDVTADIDESRRERHSRET